MKKTWSFKVFILLNDVMFPDPACREMADMVFFLW